MFFVSKTNGFGHILIKAKLSYQVYKLNKIKTRRPSFSVRLEPNAYRRASICLSYPCLSVAPLKI